MLDACKIKKIHTKNFRNLESTTIEFSTGINCILGENGNGKTNILEAIYFLAHRKSFRKKTAFPQLLSLDCGKPEIIISALLENEKDNPFSYTGKLTNDGNSWSINGRTSKSRPALKVVFINPFDSFHFHNQASFRRSWFDQYIGLLDENYRKTWGKYQYALRMRNSLLSSRPGHFLEQLRALDREIVKYSLFVTQMRLKFLTELGPQAENIFRQIFSEMHQLEIQLESDFIGLNESEIYQKFRDAEDKDLMLGHSTIGPHRDDYTLLFDGLNSFEFCSLGQQKMAFLGLLFAYIELFRYKFLSFPIVLIDDVSGELDRHRWQRLIEYLEQREFQVLITTANEKFREELAKIQGAKMLTVADGRILKDPIEAGETREIVSHHMT